MSATYEQHHLGRFLPPMVEADFKRLCEDIAANGLLEDIVLYEGKILDGWSRYRACQHARVEPRFREFAGDNPVAYVLSRHVQRRHLNPVQILRILEAARQALEAEAMTRKRSALRRGCDMAESPVGRNSGQRGRVSERIAQMAGVSRDTVDDYHAVQTRGSAELKEALDREEVSISDAADVARQQPLDKQTQAVQRVRAGRASTLRQAVQHDSVVSPSSDRLGLPIPNDLAAAFLAVSTFKEARACLARARERIRELLESPAGARLTSSDWPALARQIGELRSRLDQLEPYTLCPDCLGQGCPPTTNDGQSHCWGGGFISRRQYQRLSEPVKERLRKRAPNGV